MKLAWSLLADRSVKRDARSVVTNGEPLHRLIADCIQGDVILKPVKALNYVFAREMA
jgi:hypothetical protein